MPRLTQFDADIDRIHFIDEEDRELSLADERIEKTITCTGTKLCILDPIQTYLGGAKMNSANGVRPLMKKLGAVAARTECAILLVGHLGKKGGKAQYHGLGSVDIQVAARSVLTVGRIDLDYNMRAIVHNKSNLAPPGASLGSGLTRLAGSHMQVAECEVKRNKHLAFKIPDGKKFIRCDSLGDDYTETAIYERLSGKRIVAPKQKTAAPVSVSAKPNLLIDIQSKMQQGKGEGYRHWATTFNLKEMSKTLIFLQENGIEDYDDLVKKSAATSSDFNERLTKIKAADKRLGEISELQKHIGNYSKHREVYAQYKASGWSEDFFETHRADLALHKAAKKHFDGQGYGKNKKLPSIQLLKQEYAALLADKKKLYSGYRELKEKSRELLTAKHNADRILGITPDAQNHDATLDHRRRQRRLNGRGDFRFARAGGLGALPPTSWEVRAPSPACKKRSSKKRSRRLTQFE